MVKVVMLISAISVLSLFGCSQQDVHTSTSELALSHSDSILN